MRFPRTLRRSLVLLALGVAGTAPMAVGAEAEDPARSSADSPPPAVARLEAEPLLTADRQVVWADGRIWVRDRGDRRFRPGPAPAATPDEIELGPGFLIGPGDDDTEPASSRVAEIPDDQVMFHEAFEGEFPADAWLVYDDNGDDTTWGVETCRSHYGSHSAWCAGEGSTPACTAVPELMADTLVQKHRIAFFNYTDELLTYWAWHDYTYWPRDQLIVYLVGSVSPIAGPPETWNVIDEHTDVATSGWHQRTISLVGFPEVDGKFLVNYGVVFRYLSGCCNPTQGAFVDDVWLSGCPNIGTISLESPADGADLCSGEGTWFCWTGHEGASWYDIEWSDDPSFSYFSQERAIGDCYHVVLSGTGSLYWRVQPGNSCRTGSWTPPREVVLHQPPGTPTPIGPRDGVGVCNDSPAVYSWGAVAGVNGYAVEWDETTAYDAPVRRTVSGTSVEEQLSGTGSRYWRVRANNAGCEGSWSLNSRIELGPCAVFADGFECGSCAGWSVRVPPSP